MILNTKAFLKQSQAADNEDASPKKCSWTLITRNNHQGQFEINTVGHKLDVAFNVYNTSTEEKKMNKENYCQKHPDSL